jgi:hypothetical protein
MLFDDVLQIRQIATVAVGLVIIGADVMGQQQIDFGRQFGHPALGGHRRNWNGHGKRKKS